MIFVLSELFVIHRRTLREQNRWSLWRTKRQQTHFNKSWKKHHSKNMINWHRFVSSWQSTSSFPILFSSVSLVCKTTQALTGCWFISKPSSASSWLFFFLGSLPRASASSRVVVSGRPRVSGNISVSTPMMKAKIPTMSYSGVKMHDEKVC